MAVPRTVVWVMLMAGVAACGGSRDVAKADAAALPGPPILATDSLWGWRVHDDTSAMDGTRRTWITRISTPGAVPLSQSFDGALGFGCEGKDSFGVFVNILANAEPESDDRRTVRVRIDSMTPVTEHWIESPNGHSLFAPKPAAFLSRIRGARKLLIEYSEAGEGTKVASFDLNGLADQLRLLQRCLPR